MKKSLWGALIALAIVGGSAGVYYATRGHQREPQISEAAVGRGDIIDSVGATGVLQAVTTVQVGTQVSGTISNLYADFNSIVRKGQVIARLDTSLFQTQVEQGRANLARAEADVERLRVELDDARVKLDRARELAGRKLIPQSELDAAEVAHRSAEAQLRSSQAQVTQSRAALNQNQVNLRHTVIEAPDRRHRHLPQRRCGPDRRRQHAGANAVRDCGRPHPHAGPGQHRRSRRRAHPARPARPVPCRRAPHARIHGLGRTGPSSAGRRAERRDVSDRHRRSEP